MSSPSKPSLSADPDQRLIQRGWLFWWAWLIVGGYLLQRQLRAGQDGLIGLVLTAPFWALWLLWLIRRAWGPVAAFFSFAEDQDGNYFEFNAVPIRIVFEEDNIFLSVEDVCDALRLQGRARDLERLRELAGRAGVRSLPRRRGMYFSERGLQAWLQRRVDTDAAKFARWFELQVAVPYRRKRELQTGQTSERP